MILYGWNSSIIHLSEDGSRSTILYSPCYDHRSVQFKQKIHGDSIFTKVLRSSKTVTLKRKITQDDDVLSKEQPEVSFLMKQLRKNPKRRRYLRTVRREEGSSELREEVINVETETLSDHAPLADFIRKVRKTKRRLLNKDWDNMNVRDYSEEKGEHENAKKLRKVTRVVEMRNEGSTVWERDDMSQNLDVGDDFPEVPKRPRSSRARSPIDTEENTTATGKGSENMDFYTSMITMHDEARKELIKGWKKLSDKLYAIGIKRMGELDLNLFKDACFRKNQTEEGALELHSFWQSKLGDHNWYPFKVVEKEGEVAKEVVNESDTYLKILKLSFGCEVHDAVCKGLAEMNEYNPSGRHPVEELWNFKANRRATLKEAISVLLKLKRD